MIPSEFTPSSNFVKVFAQHGLTIGRMVSSSKSGYSKKHPNNLTVFNANIVTAEDGKIWYGDVDLTKDGEKLKEIAKTIHKTLWVLYEHHARFDKEQQPIDELLKVAVWNTTDGKLW